MKYFILVFCSCAYEILADVSRLDRTVLPNHYCIKIRPYIDEKRFDGEVNIQVTTTKELTDFTLHGLQLDVSEARVDDVPADVTYPIPGRIQLSPRNGYLTQRGDHVLHIKYNGLLNEEGTGLLMIKASGKKPDSRYILKTELGKTGARKVFPCFDDPAIKSKFALKIITPDDSYNVFTKMPETDKFHTPSGVVHVFKTSPKMSTYLVTFVITKYPFDEDVLEFDNKNLPIRLYSSNKNESDKYIVDWAKRAIKFYTRFTNINPISTLDLIQYSSTKGYEVSLRQAPLDLFELSKGLMSSVLKKALEGSFHGTTKTTIQTFEIERSVDGHMYMKAQQPSFKDPHRIGFRSMLALETIPLSENDEITIKNVLLPGIANYWFGNLVTNEWWDDVWLHDAFSIYMSYKLRQKKIQGEKDVHTFYSSDTFFEIHYGMPSPPIVHQYIENINKDDKNENIVTKGAALLLMIEDAIGEVMFQNVIQRFLRRHKHSTATSNDFISLVEEHGACCKCRDFIVSYLYQQRLPQINIERKNDKIVLQQNISATVAAFPSSSSNRWTIPIKYISDLKRTRTLIWFDKDMDSLTIDVPNAKWILFNVDGTGIYKVNYGNDLWDNIIEDFEVLNMPEIHVLSRDAMYSFEFDMIECSVLMRLMQKITPTQKNAWIFFIEFHVTLLGRLICDDHKDEIDIYKKFLDKRLKETDYSNEILSMTPEKCSRKDYVKSEKMDTCAKWIKDNLQ